MAFPLAPLTFVPGQRMTAEPSVLGGRREDVSHSA